MKLLDLAQFGVAIFSMGVLGYAIKLFIGYMGKQEDSFSEVIKNHMNHNTEAISQNTDTLNELKKVIGELCIYLKKNNK